MNRSTQSGFTLAELLITFAVAAIIMAVAVPGLRSFTLNNRQASALNQMISTMHLARSEAITRNARITVCPTDDGADCANVSWQNGWLVFVDGDGDGDVDGGEQILRVNDAVAGFEVVSPQFDEFFIYRPNGRLMVASVNDNTGQLTFCDTRGASHARVIVVSPSGRPLVQDKQLDGSNPVCP